MIDVLIVDDQNFIRKTLESYLEPESDLNVIGFAENGKAAVDEVRQLQPDVVLMDIEMPVMDGLSATKTIAEEFTNTKVLILSVRDREQDVARALELGAKGYWSKNTTASELADAIRYVHKGYFQVALELVEKHLNLGSSSNSPSATSAELNNKLQMVDAVLAQIEAKIDTLGEIEPQSLNSTIEGIVKQQVSLQNDRDLNLQFKLDRLKHQFTKQERKTNLMVQAQTSINLILAIAILVLSYLFYLR